MFELTLGLHQAVTHVFEGAAQLPDLVPPPGRQLDSEVPPGKTGGGGGQVQDGTTHQALLPQGGPGYDAAEHQQDHQFQQVQVVQQGNLAPRPVQP